MRFTDKIDRDMARAIEFDYEVLFQLRGSTIVHRGYVKYVNVECVEIKCIDGFIRIVDWYYVMSYGWKK